jgi:hypothetical protein
MPKVTQNQIGPMTIPEDVSEVVKYGSERGTEVVLQMVIPDAFLPSMLPNSSEESTPERRLLLTILEDAIGRYQAELRYRNRRRQVLRDLDYFFFSDDWDWPFSFNNICHHLNLNPEYIRLGLKKWRMNNENVTLEGKRRRLKRGGRAGSRHKISVD